MARISIIGANGSIGRVITDEALARGHQVTAVVRDTAKLGRTHDDLRVETGDVLDPADVARVAEHRDVVVSAVGGGDGAGHVRLIEPALRSLVTALRGLGGAAPRLIAVGGAGSLEVMPGMRLWDMPGLPPEALTVMHAHGVGLDYLRTVSDVRWTSLSPAAMIDPGVRTGRYRTGGDRLVSDATRQSRISTEDYAVALIDEIETPRHIGRRFTVAY
ncbi:NAD(P)-dependent oxidoreductase [Actinoplanes sp. DH11]|uniref:NAD(P)-dependent oxidoreductase n=1 Tax=Actinoplanes sp. DH11 TaxID=2857011 RepID=UPI001E315515|nr:NAD(P)H-binding protein [Actinoplanes sp. DH11]